MREGVLCAVFLFQGTLCCVCLREKGRKKERESECVLYLCFKAHCDQRFRKLLIPMRVRSISLSLYMHLNVHIVYTHARIYVAYMHMRPDHHACVPHDKESSRRCTAFSSCCS